MDPLPIVLKLLFSFVMHPEGMFMLFGFALSIAAIVVLGKWARQTFKLDD